MSRTDEIFEQVKTYLEEVGSYQDVDSGPVRIYSAALADWERLTADILQEGEMVQDRDNLPRKNPKLMAQRQAAEMVYKYAQLLGIGAYGRKKSNIQKSRVKAMTGAAALRPIQRKKAN